MSARVRRVVIAMGAALALTASLGAGLAAAGAGTEQVVAGNSWCC